jgi:hypothetical protein
VNPRSNAATARRIALAKKEGRELLRRMQLVDRLNSDETAALADAFTALFLKYPEVYPTPPVSVEALYAHAQELREAEEAVRREEAGEGDGDDAPADLDAALAAIGGKPAPRGGRAGGG